MLPYQELELRMLQYVMRVGGAWVPTTIPQLASSVNAGWPDVIDALKRLHSNEHLQLRKYLDKDGYQSFTGKTCEDQFFHQGGFEMSVAPDGRPYLEELLAAARLQTSPRLLESPAEVTKSEEKSVWNMIHPAITAIAQKKFKDTHFADAVESALKEVNKRVKEHLRAKLAKEYDGADLMNRAFSLQNPVIILGDLNTDSGKNMQQGYMQIFAGSMTGIRNPKAHENISIDSVRAVHFLFLASLLMAKLDEANVPAALSGKSANLRETEKQS